MMGPSVVASWARRNPAAGLSKAIDHAAGPHGLAWASPLVAWFVGYLVAYGAGVVTAGADASRLPLICVAVVAGLVASITGIGWVWASGPIDDYTGLRASPDPSPVVRWVGYGLALVGIAATVAYLARIGTIPLLLPNVETARVAASERGGAALRVLGMLALPGVWLTVARAAVTRVPRDAIVAIAATVVVAAFQLTTANRAPAFQTVEVALVVAVLSAGRWRVGARGVAAGLTMLAVILLLAGAVGGIRYLNSPDTWVDPEIRAGAQHGDLVGLSSLAIRNYLRVPVQNFDLTMVAVPDRIGFQFGHTYLQPLLTILPGKQTTFDADLKTALGQTYAGGGTVPGFLGEAWANFGAFGWVLVPAVVAGLLTILYRHVSRTRNVAATTLYAFLLVHTVGANLSGLSIASIFPLVAIVVLGLLAVVELRVARPHLTAGGSLA